MGVIQRAFGWKPDLPDWRDKLLQVGRYKKLPQAFILPYMPPLRDQGNLGACTGFAVATAVDFLDRDPSKVPSPLFIYYNERVMEGTVMSDEGAYLRDGVKSVAKLGACEEEHWPYLIEKFRDKPVPPAYTNAKLHRVLEYKRVPRTKTLIGMKRCLFDGFPFIFGFSVFESFMSDRVAETGIVPLPDVNEYLLGGHAVTAVGWDNSKDSMLCRNSWGEHWGDQGHFWLPYEFFSNPGLSGDFWTVRA